MSAKFTWLNGHKCQMQRLQKHFESGGALAKRGTFVYDQNQTILCCSQAERKILKIWSLYDVEHLWPLQSLYYCKKGTFIPAKEGVHSINTFSFLKCGTLAQKKGHFFHF
jgi:hypothetical protein